MQVKLTSIPTLEVRPVSISCLCRNKPTRAFPRPSSSAPRVSTPSKRLSRVKVGTEQMESNLGSWTCQRRRFLQRLLEPRAFAIYLEEVIVIATLIEGPAPSPRTERRPAPVLGTCLKAIGTRHTFPPTSSTRFVSSFRSVSISSCVRAAPIQSSVFTGCSFDCGLKRTTFGGRWPRRKMYSPRARVSSPEMRSLARSESEGFRRRSSV
jgi:hypothetical protein